MQYKNLTITKYTQSGFRIDWEGKVLYIDPFQIPDGQPPADAILLTHEHADHCDPDSLKKLLQPGTIVSGNLLVKEKLGEFTQIDFREIMPGGFLTNVHGVDVFTRKAYNLDKFHPSGRLYHPPENNGMGYRLLFNTRGEGSEEIEVYHMGDTDFLPDEHVWPSGGTVVDGKRIDKQVDILMIPVSGTYVMTPEEAITACNQIKPVMAIPMHYDSRVGSVADAEKFKAGVECAVEILTAIK